MPVLLFIGMGRPVGPRAPARRPSSACIAGVAVALYGFALALRRPVAGGVVLGLGRGIAFLSAASWARCGSSSRPSLLPLAFDRLAHARYAATAGGRRARRRLAAGARWPLALHARDPAHLRAWWDGESSADYFALFAAEQRRRPVYYLKNLLWFAWPALPLVLWTLWTRGRGFNGGLRDARRAASGSARAGDPAVDARDGRAARDLR